MESSRKPKILFVYFSYTQQSPKVVEAMAEVLRERGCEVRQAALEFTDKRYAERFSRFQRGEEARNGQGAEWLDGIHFAYAGGQIRSFLSLLSYFGKGENRERYLGVKIPPSNLKPDYLEESRAFANALADRL